MLLYVDCCLLFVVVVCSLVLYGFGCLLLVGGWWFLLLLDGDCWSLAFVVKGCFARCCELLCRLSAVDSELLSFVVCCLLRFV